MVVAHTGGEDEMGEPVAESSRNTSVMLEGLLGEAMELLAFVKMRTRNWPDVAGLFLDELSNMVAGDMGMNNKFMEQVSVKFAEDFQTEYIEDANETENHEFTVKSTFEKMLDEDTEDDSEGAPISLSLAPHVMKMMGVPSKAGPVIPVRGEQLTLVARLIPTFRLLSKSVMAKCKGDLEEIDAVLGCGVWMFPKDVVNNIRDLSVVEKNAVCATLFYVTNWFIELVNSFSTQQEEDIKVKVLLRIKQVLEMQKMIAVALKQNPSFKPPTALFSEDISWWSPPQGQEGKKGKKAGKGKKGGKGKNSKAGEPDTMVMNATLHLNTQRSQAQASQPQSNTVVMEGNNDSQEVVDLKHYRPFFRELDLSTLAVLTFMPTTTSSEPSLEEEFAEPKFRPPELLFLLRDLQAKLDKSLISVGKKRGIPG
jgi:Fanconi anemia group D2 protein